ncbi:NtaA/DmoA family FMN-dependent monooxygenase [Herbiconiux sp.]|uniref:NtaA/DmoA family FMN-dependent monooxygenase n=1 Tax=Herbiconiux sp. TaxID=1871186 RepID=UPI0025C214EA|nr:NtaA/DmoA family FMN-dependent monooxygenase [Herbiconiux sp.]
MSARADRPAIRLALNYFPAGWHEGIWHGAGDPASLLTDIDYFVWLALAAEAAKLDALFLADTIGGLQLRSHRALWGGQDPTVLLAAIASRTSNIGLVSTVSGLFGNPVEVARKVATLDHASRGRAAWNIVTSQGETTRTVFGVDEHFSDEVRYRRAGEFATLVDAYWDSLPREAIVADESRGVYLDAARTRPVNFEGEHFRSSGVLPVPVSVHGKPLVFQAGSSEASIDFGVTQADALFTARRDLAGSQTFYADVHAKSAAASRRPPLVLPGVFIYPGATEAEAVARKAELDERVNVDLGLPLLAARLGLPPESLRLDAELPYELLATVVGDSHVADLPEQIVDEARRNRWTVCQILTHNGLGAHRVLVGAGEQIADQLLDWVDARGADGFVLSFGDYRHDVPIFAETVIPRLQQLGRFRTEYDGPTTTLRQNLGL